MALDEALLESVIQGGEPVVRFYRWEPATISVGVHQALEEIDTAACRAQGFDIVRRITGGRAVLHQHELTYSVVARENDKRVSGGVIESYRKISGALVAGLRSLGVDVGLTAPGQAALRALARPRRQKEPGGPLEGSYSAVCFDVASAYELSAGGRKLVGSAQARRGGALLQHGSILLDINWEAWFSVFAYTTETAKQQAFDKLPTRMTSLRHELGRTVTAHEVGMALRRGFEEVLSVSLAADDPSEHEMTTATRLANQKYGLGEWTARA